LLLFRGQILARHVKIFRPEQAHAVCAACESSFDILWLFYIGGKNDTVTVLRFRWQVF